MISSSEKSDLLLVQAHSSIIGVISTQASRMCEIFTHCMLIANNLSIEPVHRLLLLFFYF